MVADEQPDAPKNCSAEFYFDGAINREAFEQAIHRALQRHRILRAVVRGKGNRLFWHPTERASPICWSEGSELQGHEDFPRLDITQIPGHRCWVNVHRVAEANGNEDATRFRSTLRVDFHHACCDAIGGMRFMEDAFIIYDSIIHNKEPKLRAIDEDRILCRAKMPWMATLGHNIVRTFVDLKKSFRLLFRRSLSIPTLGECEPWTKRFIVRHLPEDELVNLRYAASEASATLNDFLLVEFFCLLRDWVKRETTQPKDHDHIRVITPMNLREREDLSLEAANKIGFSFLSRSMKQLCLADVDQWRKFISEISAEVDEAKRMRLPAQFLKKLAIARRSQSWFERCLTPKRCWGTAVMTQLGDPTRRFYTRFPRKNGRIMVGDLLLTSFVSCGPLRPLTHAILSANAYGNELTLSMRCDQKKIARATAESFLDEFVDRLKSRSAMLRDPAATTEGSANRDEVKTG